MAKQLAVGSSQSHLYRDEDVRTLANELLRERLTINAIRDRIKARFGAGRTPSRSAIGRYVRKARLQLGIDFSTVG